MVSGLMLRGVHLDEGELRSDQNTYNACLTTTKTSSVMSP